MSALILRRAVKLRNWKKMLLFSIAHDCTSLRVGNPCLNSITRQRKYFTTMVHKYKTLEYYTTKGEFVNNSKNSGEAAIEKAVKSIDFDIQRFGRAHRRNVEGILSMITDTGSASDTQSLYLIRSCGLMLIESPAERVQFADFIWRKLQDLGHQFKIDHLNALLKVYINSCHQFSPSTFLALIGDHSVEPNKITFQYLLQKYCNDGDLDGASEILEFMKEKGFTLNETIFNILIGGHMKANDVSGAKDIFEVMKSSNLLPSVNSYTALACGFAEKGDIDAIKSVIQEAEKNGAVLHVKHLMKIISSLSSDEHIAYVDEVMNSNEKHVFDYRQLILNTALELIHKDSLEIPFRLVLSVAKSEERGNYSSNIFFYQLIKNGKPVEKIINFCEEINSLGLNDYAFMNAAKAATDLGRFDYALSFFQIIQKKGIAVRAHNFWPILSHYRNSEKEILSILRSMFDFGIPLDFITYEEYVFPAISVSNPDNVLAKIQDTGHTITGAIDALFYYYCNNGQFDNACFLIEKCPVRIFSDFNFEKVFSLSETQEPESSALKVLTYVMKNIIFPSKGFDERRGKILALLIQLNPTLFNILLKNSALEGFKYRETLDVCYSILADNDPNKLVHLRKLENYSPSHNPLPNISMSVEEEERQLNLLKSKGLPVDSFLKELLKFHLQKKNIERVNWLTTEIDSLGIRCGPLTYSNLIRLYCESDNIEMARKSLKILKENYPDFKMDTARIADYATLLLKYSKFEDAIEVIKSECKELHVFGSKELIVKNLKRLFQAAVDTGNVDFIKNLQGLLVHLAKELGNIKLCFEPFIKFHLYRNDIDSAIEEFHNCIVNHGISPCLDSVLKKCILADDQVKLEKVINTAVLSEGKPALHHKLIMALFETGRRTQAKTLIENLGNRIDIGFLQHICGQLYNQNKISDLTEFISMIQDVETIDKENIFSFLFKLFDEQNDYEKALDLFHLIERQKSFSLSDKTKALLINLFTKNNISIPSSIYRVNKSISETSVNTDVSRNECDTYSDESITEFQDLLRKGKTLEAVEKLQHMKKGLIRTLPLIDMTHIINLVVQERSDELSYSTQAMSYIIENANEILKPLFEKYSEAGDIQSMTRLTSIFPDFVLKKNNYNSFMAQTYLSCGKHEDLLLELENRWNKKFKMFSVVAFKELMKVPDLRERVKNLAKRYSEVNFDLPIAIVWAHYFVNGNFDEASELNKFHSVAVDRVDLQVLRVVREDQNIKLGKKYIEVITEANARLRCKEKAYGTLLDVLVLKEMYNEAVDLSKEAKEKGLNLEISHRSTFITLKSALERENKPVPFTLPPEDFITSG